MSGILDNKSRVLDTIITDEGKKQLSDGTFNVQFASFSDVGTYYKADITSGSADATSRIYLEQSNLPQDQITLLSDVDGLLTAYKNSYDLLVKDGQLIQHSFQEVESGNGVITTFLTGTALQTASQKLMRSSLEHFNKLRLIGTKNKVFEDDQFAVGPSNITFTITDSKPIADKELREANVNRLDSLFQDVRLSFSKNFAFLPPITKVEDHLVDKTSLTDTKPYRLGSYSPLGFVSKLKPEELESELQWYVDNGYSKTITFDPTSVENRIFSQIFEVSHSHLKKLHILDYGTYVWNGVRKHAFFVGKLVVDDKQTHTFIHMFTLLFG